MKKSRLVYWLATVLSGGLFWHCNLSNAEGTATNTTPPGQLYRNDNYGFQFAVPEGWTATETNFSFALSCDVFLTVNNLRPGLAVRNWPTGKNAMGFGPQTTLEQLRPGEVYVAIGYSSAPIGETMQADAVGDDLHSVLATSYFSPATQGLSELNLGFFKRGHWWFILADMREPVTGENRQKVMALLQSFRFVDAPVHNASWAESLAWKKLPEKIRDTAVPWWNWPVAGQAGETSGAATIGQRSILVTNAGPAFSVKFTLKGIGEWSFRVGTNGEVETEPPMVHPVPPVPAQWPSDLPGASNGIIDAYWIAPYVQASRVSGKTTLTWFAGDGRVERQATVDGIQPGFVWVPGRPGIIRGINEDWQITLPVDPRDVRLAGYITSTADSRVFVQVRHPKQGLITLDYYVDGKLADTVGPFFQYSGNDVVLNEDGSAGMLIGKDESRNEAQVVVLNTNGGVRFRTDCGSAVMSPEVAPDGAGVLLRPSTGTNHNTFMWFTAQGRQRSMDISPNPECLGWVPQTRQSLFMKQAGFETAHFELIDWDTGTRLWDIPCPGDGELLGFGLTPKLIILAVAEAYPPGTTRNQNDSLVQSGKEWVRTFYAVNAADGSLVARWTGLFPRPFGGADRDFFLRRGGKLFYVSANEFTEINLEDITAKKNGWQ